jgi:hypothetical protein
MAGAGTTDRRRGRPVKITILDPKDNSPHGYDADPTDTVSFLATSAYRDFGYPAGADVLSLAPSGGQPLNRNATVGSVCKEGVIYRVASVGNV